MKQLHINKYISLWAKDDDGEVEIEFDTSSESLSVSKFINKEDAIKIIVFLKGQFQITENTIAWEELRKNL